MDKIEAANCQLCGEPMPQGEEMFFYHGYSGPCPKPPLAMSDKTAVPESTNTLHEDLEPGFPESEAEKLRGLIAACYMMVGVLIHDGAPIPAKWLDVLSAAAHGQPFDEEGLLPFVGTPAASPVAGVSGRPNFHRLSEADYQRIKAELKPVKATQEAFDNCRVICSSLESQIAALNAQPEGDGWIAVSPETMPEHMEVVRVVTHSGYQEVCVYRAVDNSFETHSGLRVNIVLHWKPLDWPSPPVGEKP